MTLSDLNASGYYLCSLGQTKDCKRFWCTVRSISDRVWSGSCAGADTLEEALSHAYENVQALQRFGRPKYETRLNLYHEPAGPRLSLEALGMVKPLKRRSLNDKAQTSNS